MNFFLTLVKDNTTREFSGNNEGDSISKDVQILTKISNLSVHLQIPHEALDDIVREMIAQTTRQLAEKNNPGVHATCLELNLKTG